MKKFIFSTISILGISLLFSGTVFAQEMMGFSSSSTDSASIQSQQQEEKEGKQILDDLNNKTVICSQLKDTDFEKIGEYFMGQSIGDTSRHIAMNKMMKSMMGEQGEEQMHTAWGKRGSGCNTSAMNFGFTPFGGFSWIFMFVFWGLIIWAIIVLIRGGFRRGHMCGHDHEHGAHEKEKSPIEILKERYAKGEIDRKEFEERKRDLN